MSFAPKPTVHTTCEIVPPTEAQLEWEREWWEDYERRKQEQMVADDTSRKNALKAAEERVKRLREAEWDAQQLRELEALRRKGAGDRKPYEVGYPDPKPAVDPAGRLIGEKLKEALDEKLSPFRPGGTAKVPMTEVRKHLMKELTPAQKGREALRAVAKRLTLEILSMADYAPDLMIAQLKEADQLARVYEKLRDNVQSSAEQAKIELNQIMRDSLGSGEFEDVRIEKLERRLDGYRTQWEYFNQKFLAALDARTEVISASGYDWGEYTTFKEMQQRSMTKRRYSTASLDALRGLGPIEYRNRLKEMVHVHLNADGVVAGDGTDLAGANALAAGEWANAPAAGRLAAADGNNARALLEREAAIAANAAPAPVKRRRKKAAEPATA